MNVSDMLRIAHSISAKVHTTTPHTNIESVSKTLKTKGIGALPVVSDGKIIGVISERDIVNKVVAEGQNPIHTLVIDVMTPNPITATPKHTLEECHKMMETGHFRHLPILENDKLIGMISMRDILVALLQENSSLLQHYTDYIYTNR